MLDRIFNQPLMLSPLKFVCLVIKEAPLSRRNASVGVNRKLTLIRALPSPYTYAIIWERVWLADICWSSFIRVLQSRTKMLSISHRCSRNNTFIFHLGYCYSRQCRLLNTVFRWLWSSGLFLRWSYYAWFQCYLIKLLLNDEASLSNLLCNNCLVV